jgi:hypothetical protein
MTRNMGPISQAFAVLAISSAIAGYESAAIAISVIIIGLEVVITAALNDDEE